MACLKAEKEQAHLAVRRPLLSLSRSEPVGVGLGRGAARLGGLERRDGAFDGVFRRLRCCARWLDNRVILNIIRIAGLQASG